MQDVDFVTFFHCFFLFLFESHSGYLMTVNGCLVTLVLLLFGEINVYRGEVVIFAENFYST
jgi:hypothetical protein